MPIATITQQRPLKLIQRSNQPNQIKIEGRNIPSHNIPQNNGIINQKPQIIAVQEVHQPIKKVQMQQQVQMKMESIQKRENNSNYPSPQKITENVPIMPE